MVHLETTSGGIQRPEVDVNSGLSLFSSFSSVSLFVLLLCSGALVWRVRTVLSDAALLPQIVLGTRYQVSRIDCPHHFDICVTKHLSHAIKCVGCI